MDYYSRWTLAICRNMDGMGEIILSKVNQKKKVHGFNHMKNKGKHKKRINLTKPK